MTTEPWQIRIEHEGLGSFAVSVDEIKEQGGTCFPIRERVSGASGLAVDFRTWYTAWRQQLGSADSIQEPASLHVKAQDTFEAQIPWSQLADAALGIADDDGSPLSRGGPVRLYVPSGSSDCLHVKQLVLLQFAHTSLPNDEATYGFKNVFSPDELRKG
ncbi:hypothetical protein [Paenibacillus daejeonensis]|uniref:hypothetical protein n=1 Tax=Paenibacillus daejeonensis TaxID=135193 RepID=UPI000361939A|nr:hypothetical protein [Paenibacillus daejeonensis]